MDIIQRFIEKHNGKYHEEFEKITHTSIGKYSYQAKRGEILYKGYKITVSINEVGGANPVSELFRMKLVSDTSFNTKILIFPRSYWSRMIRLILTSKNGSLANTIHRQYKFTGSKELISKLITKPSFLNSIIGESVCINLSVKKPNIIIITPSHGYKSVEHLEKLAETLIIVKAMIGNTYSISHCPTTPKMP